MKRKPGQHPVHFLMSDAEANLYAELNREERVTHRFAHRRGLEVIANARNNPVSIELALALIREERAELDRLAASLATKKAALGDP